MKALIAGFGLMVAGASFAQMVPCEVSRVGCGPEDLPLPDLPLEVIPVDGDIQEYLFESLPLVKSTLHPLLKETHGIAAANPETGGYTKLSCTKTTARAISLSCNILKVKSPSDSVIVTGAHEVIQLLQKKPGSVNYLSDKKVAMFLFDKLPSVTQEGPLYSEIIFHGLAAPIPGSTGTPTGYAILSCKKKEFGRAFQFSCNISAAASPGDYPVVQDPKDVIELFKAAPIEQDQ